MRVLFFAQCRQIAGRGEFVLKTYRDMTQEEFWASLAAAFPGMEEQRKSARLARDEAYLQPGDLLHPGDEIAVIPPVSGG